MTSFDYRVNLIRTIKECSSCGALYTADFCCSKKGLEDKILVPIPESSQRPIIIEKICFNCGDPVHGLYCPRCALIRKTLEEVFQNLQDTSGSSDDNTNVVNAPREPIVVNQDPGKNSSPSPPHIDHCCHECGDSLDGIFCRQCTCKFCGKGAHYGYNCPPKVPIISNPEPCKNQTIGEHLQNLQRQQQQCLLGTCQKCGCNEYDGVCFYCKVGNETPINVSTPYSSNDSPSVASHPPQSQYVPYSCELCGNDSHYGYDCPPQVPFVYNQDPCFNQHFDYFPQTSPSFPQQYLCCENCGGPHETFQCQPINEDYYHEQNSCYDSNSFGFDQVQPTQYTVNHPIFNSQNELLNSGNKLMEQMTTLLVIMLLDTNGQLYVSWLVSYTKEGRRKRIAARQAAKIDMEDSHFCYDDVEDGILDKMFDVPLCENTTPLNAFNEHSEIVVNSNDDNSSSDDDSTYGEDIDYVMHHSRDNPTPPSNVLTKSTSTFSNLFLKETNTFDNSIPKSETFRFNLEEISSGSPTTHFELSLPDYKAFYVDNDHFKEKSNGSTTTHVDFSRYDSFIFDLSNDQFPPADRSDLYHEEFASIVSLTSLFFRIFECFKFKISARSERFDFY
ncbi:hypothetical protein Tco_1507949 [Tanacetum coccineum]